MSELLDLPAQILGVAALVALLFTLGGKQRMMNIRLYSTYLVVHPPLLAIGSALLLGINALPYWWFPQASWVPWLTVGHVILLLVSTLVLLLTTLFFKAVIKKGISFGSVQRLIYRALGLLLLGQFLGLANWLSAVVG